MRVRSRRVRRALALLLTLAGLVGLYALAGYWALPAFGRAPLERALGEALGGTVTIGHLELDPFRLRGLARTLRAADAQGREWLRADALAVDLCLCSAWQRAWVVETLTLGQPALALERDAQGRIALPFPARGERDAGGTPPAFALRTLALRAGRVVLTDRSLAPPQAFALEDVTLGARDLRSGGSGTLELSARGPDGARLRLAGTLAPVPLAADLRAQLSGLRLARYAAYLPPGPRDALAGGHGALQGRVLYDGAGLRLTGARAEVAGLALRGADHELLGAAQLEAAGVAADFRTRALQVAAVRAQGVRADVRRDPDGTLDLVQALVPAAAAQQPSVSAPAAGSSRPARAWRVTVGEAALAATAVRFSDAATQPPFVLRLDSLTLDARDYDSAAPAPLPVTLAAALADGGTLRAQGTLTPDPLALSATLTAEALPLPLAQPYLARAAHLALRAGTLAGQGALEWQAADTAATRFRGELAVAGLDVHDTLHDAPLLGWEALRAREVVASPGGVEAASVRLRGPRMRYRIGPGGRSNLHGLMRRREARPAEDTAPPPAPGGAAQPSAPQVRIAQLTVRGGTLDFADETLPTPFAATIEQLQGTVNVLSSAPGSTTRATLEGRVDGYAPARIEATITPGKAVEAQFALRFRDLELASFSPYAGKFAGYRIRSGTADLDLEYTVDGRRLAGRNRLVLNRLELGERVQSPTATDLPVGLAIALLRDRNGVIDLDLPVRGDLADPQFDFRALVGKALRAAVRKVVTAPFAFLAGLVGGEEPPRAVSYPPGVATLAPRQVEALRPLAQALGERPGVGVVISGAAGTTGDARALAQARLGEALAAGDEDTPWERLRDLYRERFGSDPEDDLPPPPAGTEPTREERRQAAFQHARARLIGAFLPDAAALEALAKARAAAVRAALIAAGVDGARLDAGAVRLVADTGAELPVETTLRLR